MKESAKLNGGNYSADGGDDHDGNGVEGSDAEGEGKKKKPPNMTRLLKSRLQKLVDKTDEEYVSDSTVRMALHSQPAIHSGRILAAEFLDLPNKKKWPMYYKQIKRPQCIENIFVCPSRRRFLRV